MNDPPFLEVQYDCSSLTRHVGFAKSALSTYKPTIRKAVDINSIILSAAGCNTAFFFFELGASRVGKSTDCKLAPG